MRLHPRVAAIASLGLALTLSCASPPGDSKPGAARIHTAPAPSAAENYCAWYGDSDGSILYSGLSPFWSAMRAAGGDPQADLAKPGPRWIGRFDLAEERWLAPLVVGGDDSRAGVWDVHHSEGQLYFTTFYEAAGRVDLATQTIHDFPDSQGLNEIVTGPDGSVLISRYGSGEAGPGDGELVLVDALGEIHERVRLKPPRGLHVAPKTPAWDSARKLFWATSDLIAADGSASPHRDAFRVPRGGSSSVRQRNPELQFARFDELLGSLAELDAEGRLWLRTLGPSDNPGGGTRLLLDPAFPASHDFVQDIKRSGDQIVLTRWSGKIHIVSAAGELRSIQLPRPQPDGLYYTAVLHGDRLCATYCAGVSVVCIDAP